MKYIDGRVRHVHLLPYLTIGFTEFEFFSFASLLFFYSILVVILDIVPKFWYFDTIKDAQLHFVSLFRLLVNTCQLLYVFRV